MKTKINYKNVLKLILFVLSGLLITYDLFMLTIYPFISGKITTFTMFGLITFILAVFIFCDIYNQIKNVSNTGTVKHKNK